MIQVRVTVKYFHHILALQGAHKHQNFPIFVADQSVLYSKKFIILYGFKLMVMLKALEDISESVNPIPGVGGGGV